MPLGARTRPRLKLFLPAALLVLIAVLWSVFWLYASREAARQMDRVLFEQASRGNRIVCADRAITGFPFRLELRCGKVTAELQSEDGPLYLGIGGLAATVQLPWPSHVILELASPVTYGRLSADDPDITLSFASLMASAHGSPSRFDRASLQISSPVVGLAAGGGQMTDALRANALAFHVRRTPDGPSGAYELATSLDDSTLPLLESPLAKAPTGLELQAEFTGLDALARGVTPDTLRAFAEQAGKVNLVLLRAVQADMVAELKGSATLETTGYPAGTFTLTALNMGKLVQQLSAEGVPGAYSLLALGRPARLDDKPASSYAVLLQDGRLAIGPVTIGDLPPLF